MEEYNKYDLFMEYHASVCKAIREAEDKQLAEALFGISEDE